MLHSLLPLLQTYAWLLLVSVLLMAFYQIFLSRKHAYRFMRRYLLAIPLVCLVQVGAYFMKVHVEAQQAPEVITMTAQEADAYVKAHPEVVVQEEAPEVIATLEIPAEAPASEEAPVPTPASFTLTADALLTMLYVAVPMVSITLLVLILLPLLRLRLKVRRHALTNEGEKNLVRASWVTTPFSFGRTIFLPCGRTSTEENLFIQHERAHIESRHYVDVWMIEILTRLMWFNPVLWYVRKTLRDLHEFEADRQVLQQGADVYAYQCLLVSEASEDCTIIANGFNNSFIRRRIKEMKRTEHAALGGFGKLLTALWMLAIGGGTFAFALPQKPATIVHVVRDTRAMGVDTCYVEESVAPPQVSITQPSFIVHTHGDSTEFTSIVSETPDSMYSQRLFIKYPARSKEEATAISSRIQNQVQTMLRLADVESLRKNVESLRKNVAQAPTAPSPASQQEENKEIPQSTSTEYEFPTHDHNGWRYVMDLPLHAPNDQRRMWIRHEGNETHITFAKYISSDDEIVRFGGPDSYIVDTATGYHYKARRSIPAYAWHYFHVKGMKGKTVDITVVFPRIHDTARWISLYQVTSHLQSGERINVKQYLQK